MPSPTRTWRQGLLPTLLLLLLATPSSAQTRGRVSAAENLRKDPNGVILAHMRAGAPLTIFGSRGSWTEVEIGGWVWARSLEKTDREGFTLVVSQEDGENMRDAPRGDMQAYLLEGTLLDEVERQPGWVRVKRRAWMWKPSVSEDAAPERRTPAAEPPATRAPARPAAGPPARTDAAGGANDRPTAELRETGFATVGGAGAAILSSPGGDTVGTTAPNAELEVVARQGSWARVRLEGWTWLPPGDSAVAGGTPGDLTPAELRADPQGTAGRVVAWQLQFISLERAERVRTDFFEGEPFILARYGGAEGPFVYVAVPTDRVPEVQGLVPLELISVTARVRTGASSLTGTPIVDLVSLERTR